MTEIEQSKALLGLTADIVSAHVKNNQIAAADVPVLIGQVYAALRDAGSAPVAAEPAAQKPEVERAAPVVSPKKSIFPDYIICLEDGRKLKTLKRHLRSTYNLTPEQYREKWDLPADYPMVAPNYAEHRSALAKQLGLGRKPAGKAPEAAAELPFEPVAPPPPAPAARQEPAAERPRESRSEHTAASVFAKFPRQDAAPEEPSSAAVDGGKSRRKPFSKQLARSMRP